jgi:hypothetical protein
MGGDGLGDGFVRQGAIGLVGLDLDQAFGGVQAMQADLRLDRVAVGRECPASISTTGRCASGR